MATHTARVFERVEPLVPAGPDPARTVYSLQPIQISAKVYPCSQAYVPRSNSARQARCSSELCDLARRGELERIKMLLECGVSPDSADYDGRTSLHLAASTGNMHVVKALIEHSSNINFQDRWGGTALADAVREGHTAVAKELFTKGGSLKYDQARALVTTRYPRTRHTRPWP